MKQLKAAGCVEIFREKVTGAHAARPQLRRMISRLRSDDVVVVAKLDRLARSTVDLLELVREIDMAGAGLVSLAEPWADTTSPAGKLIVTVFAGVAQFERERMLERCKEGRELARQRGIRPGPKHALNPERAAAALQRMKDGERPEVIALTFNVSRSTAYRLRNGGVGGLVGS